jgi:hypothetical protein
MCIRERHGRELWWILNLVVGGVGGVLLNPFCRIGWIMEEYHERLENIF